MRVSFEIIVSAETEEKTEKLYKSVRSHIIQCLDYAKFDMTFPGGSDNLIIEGEEQ